MLKRQYQIVLNAVIFYSAWVLFNKSRITTRITVCSWRWCIDRLVSFEQAGYLCVLIHIWTKGEVGAQLNRFELFSKIFLLTVPRRCFFCGSFMLFLSCNCYAFVCVCLYAPCGHLLGKDWPLGSRLWCLAVSLLLSHWYPGSGVVLDCIDSWSLHLHLLL